MFEYGGAVEEIADANISFEQLRIDKSADFPELEDGKKISWTMEYGSIKKPVSNPKEVIIAKLKSEIEISKEFLTALKKAKDKKPTCKVKPTIRAQSKGIAAYKGIFTTKAENIAELSEVEAGFMPALPLIPFSLLAHFRHFMKNGLELEALVHILTVYFLNASIQCIL